MRDMDAGAGIARSPWIVPHGKGAVALRVAAAQHGGR